VGALVIFQATDVCEATADERRALMEARKASKLQAKQRRAARTAERDATKTQMTEKQSAQRVSWARRARWGSSALIGASSGQTGSRMGKRPECGYQRRTRSIQSP
jgi:hypothetical protein